MHNIWLSLLFFEISSLISIISDFIVKKEVSQVE